MCSTLQVADYLEMGVRCPQGILDLDVLVERGPTQFVDALLERAPAQPLQQVIQLHNLLRGEQIEELFGNFQSKMGSPGVGFVTVLSELLPVEDLLRQYLIDFLCLQLAFVDLFFVVEVVGGVGGRGVCQSLVEEQQIEFDFNPLGMVTVELLAQLVDEKKVFVCFFKLGLFHLQLGQKEVVLIDLIVLDLLEVVVDLDGSLGVVDGLIDAPDFPECDRVVDQHIHVGLVESVLASDFQALRILVHGFRETFDFVVKIGEFELGSRILEDTVMREHKLEVDLVKVDGLGVHLLLFGHVDQGQQHCAHPARQLLLLIVLENVLFVLDVAVVKGLKVGDFELVDYLHELRLLLQHQVHPADQHTVQQVLSQLFVLARLQEVCLLEFLDVAVVKLLPDLLRCERQLPRHNQRILKLVLGQILDH